MNQKTIDFIELREGVTIVLEEHAIGANHGLARTAKELQLFVFVDHASGGLIISFNTHIVNLLLRNHIAGFGSAWRLPEVATAHDLIAVHAE